MSLAFLISASIRSTLEVQMVFRVVIPGTFLPDVHNFLGNNSFGFEIFGGGGGDSLQGGNLSDLLDGGVDNDFLNGSGGDDLLSGGDGGDTLRGGAGNDMLSGGAGVDGITGGSGRDVLTGGGGTDYFIFKSVLDSPFGAGRDRITDFTTGQDHIDLDDIDANNLISGNQAFMFIGSNDFTGIAGQLRVVATTALNATFVSGDINGDRIVDFQIELTGIYNLNSSYFDL
jgi:serralysin